MISEVEHVMPGLVKVEPKHTHLVDCAVIFLFATDHSALAVLPTFFMSLCTGAFAQSLQPSFRNDSHDAHREGTDQSMQRMERNFIVGIPIVQRMKTRADTKSDHSSRILAE